MYGPPPPPPRAFGLSPPRNHSRPPPAGRCFGRPLMNGGRPPVPHRQRCPPHPLLLGPEADHADPDDRRVRRRVDNDGCYHSQAGGEYPCRWSPPRRPEGPPRGPPWRSPPRRPAGPPQGPSLPPWLSPQRGPEGAPRGPRRCSPPRRPAGPRHGSPRWSPPRRPAGPSDDPRCWPPGPPVDDNRRSYGSWPPPPPSSCAHGYASAGEPWPTGGYDPTGSWSSAWRPPPYPVGHRLALWSGD